VKTIVLASRDSVKGLFVSKLLTLYVVGRAVENGDLKMIKEKQMFAAHT
jgi:D-alanyl-D-alanine carboxypeptidase